MRLNPFLLSFNSLYPYNSDSDKKVHQGWGGDDGPTELKQEEAAVTDAVVEGSGDWGAPASGVIGVRPLPVVMPGRPPPLVMLQQTPPRQPTSLLARSAKKKRTTLSPLTSILLSKSRKKEFCPSLKLARPMKAPKVTLQRRDSPRQA